MTRARLASAALLATTAALAACGPAPAEPGVLFLREDPRFELRLVELPGDTGDGRQLSTRVTPRGAWHLSTEYPVRLELEGKGVRLAKARHAREDASELSEAGVEFRSGFAHEGGARARVSGDLRFGICLGRELCEPVGETFAAEIP